MASQTVIALPLPDGRWVAFTRPALDEAIALAMTLGLGAAPAATTNSTAAPERWLDSSQLGDVIGAHSTTIEAWAKSGKIPSMRLGKLLRFKLSLVEPALQARS